MKDEKQHYADLLRTNLARATRLRAEVAPDDNADRMRLREWQSLRLARTHRDLLDSPRYGPAARFFLDDLYGPKDFSQRDQEVARIIPLLTRMLPPSALHTIALAVELDALSEELDSAMIGTLRASARTRRIDDIDEGAYAAAYRACDNRVQREQQIRLVGEIGGALARLTRMPLLAGLLRAMRGPAHLAGLAALHEFLERGFAAFKHMGQADDFLRLIAERELALMQAMFAPR